MPVIEQKTTNKNKVDFDLNRLDKSKTTIFSKYPKHLIHIVQYALCIIRAQSSVVNPLLAFFLTAVPPPDRRSSGRNRAVAEAAAPAFSASQSG